MDEREQHQQQIGYFNDRYLKVVEYSFRTDDRTFIRDHLEDVDRRCRFCNQGHPNVTFRSVAHALPDFLGNQSIISMNECDACNDYFGSGCEDNLSKATLLHRTLAGIPRKKGPKTTFKSNDESLRIDVKGHKVDMRCPEPQSIGDLIIDGELPNSIKLVGDTRSQPYVPMQAAMALVKVACSITPVSEIENLRGAVDWITGRRFQQFESFPVSFAFTPGTFDERVSRVILLKRKNEGPEPFMWCILQFRNFRFQISVPFCPGDRAWFGKPEECETKFEHYPSIFPPDWPPGPTRFHWLNWALDQKVRTPASVSHKVERTVSITRPSSQ